MDKADIARIMSGLGDEPSWPEPARHDADSALPEAAPNSGFPDTVFVPAHPAVREGRPVFVYEVRPLPDGGWGLPVFSSPQRLVDTLGRAQPWVCLPLADVEAIAGCGGLDQVVVDAGVDPEAWRWSAADFEPIGQG